MPVLIATPDVVLDAHANDIALRQVSEEKEVCLKDLISRADWMRAMKVSREAMEEEKQKPVSEKNMMKELLRFIATYPNGVTIQEIYKNDQLKDFLEQRHRRPLTIMRKKNEVEYTNGLWKICPT